MNDLTKRCMLCNIQVVEPAIATKGFKVFDALASKLAAVLFKDTHTLEHLGVFEDSQIDFCVNSR